MKRALISISGITGQDGSYLAELLLEQGYEVHGIVRRIAIEDPAHRMGRIEHLMDRIKVDADSIENLPSLYRIFINVAPDECYHLATQNFVSYSFDDEFSTMASNINGTHNMLVALKETSPHCRLYFAATSEMFGKVEEMPQSERTRFPPRSAYGISQIAGFDLTWNYREAHGIHASSGIFFNPPGVDTNLSPARSPAGSRESCRAKEKTSRWEIWTRNGTGGTPETTSGRCG